jgi:phage terminase small subunit
MRGRKPKPTALKLIEGAQKCRINGEQPPTKPGDLDPPGWINGDAIALEHWKEVAPIAKSMGLLTESSRLALAQLCDEFSIMRTTKRNGAAKDRYRRLLIEFGFTPSSLSRIKAQGPPPKDKLALFLEENKA